MTYCCHPSIAETAIFTKSGHVHMGNWPIVTLYAFLLQAGPVSNSTIAPRPGRRSSVTTRIFPVILPALSHLFQCLAVGAFASLQMALLFLSVGCTSELFSKGWSYTIGLKIFDMLNNRQGDRTGRSWRQNPACCSNNVSSGFKFVPDRTGQTSGTSGQSRTHLRFVPFTHRSMSSGQN